MAGHRRAFRVDALATRAFHEWSNYSHEWSNYFDSLATDIGFIVNDGETKAKENLFLLEIAIIIDVNASNSEHLNADRKQIRNE